MIKKYFSRLIFFLFIEMFLCLPILLCLPLLKESTTIPTSTKIHQKNISYPVECRGTPTYDTITGEDNQPHYRVFFWVPKTATILVPSVDSGVETDVSSHGPVEKWSVVETQTTDDNKKLVFIFVPKTFVYLYGNGFENVIHLSF